MRVLFLLILIWNIVACNTTPTASVSQQHIYLDNAFDLSQTSPVETPEQLFHITPEMKHYVRTRLESNLSLRDKADRLVHDLFSPEHLNISYIHSANLTASQTFEKGEANCLSLTILAMVLTNEAGLAADIMDVKLEENWTVTESMSMINGHVNLRLKTQKSSNEVVFLERKYTIDFLPMINAKVISKRFLNRAQVTALFYNNMGASALTNKDLNQAYVYFKAATQTAPELPSSWNNLATVYRQAEQYEAAKTLYLRSLDLQPDNLNTLENLAKLYGFMGNEQKAEQMRAHVVSARLKNPNYHAMLAEEAYYKDEFEQSIKHYDKAIRLNNQDHLFYFGQAKSYFALKKYETARKKLLKAHKLADLLEDKDKYKSKMSLLRNNYLTRR